MGSEQNRGQSPTSRPRIHLRALLPQVREPYLPPRGLGETAYHWILFLVNTFQQPMGSLGVSSGTGRD